MKKPKGNSANSCTWFASDNRHNKKLATTMRELKQLVDELWYAIFKGRQKLSRKDIEKLKSVGELYVLVEKAEEELKKHAVG